MLRQIGHFMMMEDNAKLVTAAAAEVRAHAEFLRIRDADGGPCEIVDAEKAWTDATQERERLACMVARIELKKDTASDLEKRTAAWDAWCREHFGDNPITEEEIAKIEAECNSHEKDDRTNVLEIIESIRARRALAFAMKGGMPTPRSFLRDYAARLADIAEIEDDDERMMALARVHMESDELTVLLRAILGEDAPKLSLSAALRRVDELQCAERALGSIETVLRVRRTST